MILWLLYVFFLFPFATYELIRWTKKLVVWQGYDKYMYLKRRLSSTALITAIKRRMSLINRLGGGGRGDTFLLHIFSEYYVQGDDVLLLRLIEENSGLIVSTDLLNEIWAQFQASLDD